MNMIDKLFLEENQSAVTRIISPVMYFTDTLTLTYREAEVSWPTLSTEETLKVSFTQASVAAAIIFTDV